MPSLFRFLLVILILGGLTAAGLYVLSTVFEPESREVSQPVTGVKVRR